MFYRQKLNQEYSQQFMTLFQQWDIDLQKAEEQEEKLAVGIMISCTIYYNQVSSSSRELSLVSGPWNRTSFHFSLLAVFFRATEL